MQDLIEQFFNLDVMLGMLPELVTEGMKNTVVFTFFSFLGGALVGLVVALMRLSGSRLVRWPAAIFIDLFRGLPALLVIIFVGLGVPIAFPGMRFPFPQYTPGCLALSLVAGAYMAETIRAGIEAVPRGQMEAARSLGMSHRTAMRRVVLPQAFRIVIPPLTNELVVLFKDTSLLAVLGTLAGGKEITNLARDAANANFNSSALVAGGLAYLVITIPLIRLVGLLERRSAGGR